MYIDDFSVATKMESVRTDLQVSQQGDYYVVLRFTADFEKKITPQPISVEWTFPVNNILSVWTPLEGFSRFIKPNWDRTKSESKTARGAPVLSLVNHDNTNACTIAISDPKTPTEIGVGVSEEKAVFFCRATFFTSYISPMDHYEAYIRIDYENIPFVDAVKRANTWWETEFGYQKAYVPQAAYLPMDSTWYSFHQDLVPEKLIEQCRLSSQLGMKTIIIDDGWQTTNSSRGYRYCGDWQLATEKIPDMKALTDEIHKLGMKVMLWFSVPYVGIYSKAYERFRDMALKENKGVLIVDIRYQQVREYLVQTYVTAVKDFGLDGLKLDFIDQFLLTEDSPPVNDKMDIPSVEDALEDLLQQTKKALLQIDPEILLEFRQRYIGPAVLKYGNMIRVSDCPHDSMRNRAGIINLRLTSGKTAVHSDMLMWNKNAPVATAARQLISTLFGVPQVSVVLRELSGEHLEAVRFWLDFYRENRELLHSDELYVKNPELGYTQVKTRKNDAVIGVNYANVPFEIGDDHTYTLINSADEDRMCIHCTENMGAVDICVYDCLGRPVKQKQTQLSPGATMLDVPMCGFVRITKKEGK